jgi:toxin ParE1/3/4
VGTFTLTQKAKSDLKSIAAYTERRWGRHQRRIYAKQFDDAFHMLAVTPKTGVACDFIKTGYRKFPCSSHIIFYRSVNDTKIEVVRILHRRMDARKQLGVNHPGYSGDLFV